MSEGSLGAMEVAEGDGTKEQNQKSMQGCVYISTHESHGLNWWFRTETERAVLMDYPLLDH